MAILAEMKPAHYVSTIAVVDTTSSACLGGVLIPHTMALFDLRINLFSDA